MPWQIISASLSISDAEIKQNTECLGVAFKEVGTVLH